MKRTLITILRDKTTSFEQYRQAADRLAAVLAVETDALLPKEAVFVETPLAKTHGVRFKTDVVLVPILRSGLAMLKPFLQFHQTARVGFIGARRDEETAAAELYYVKLPYFTEENPIFILDPMIATGGSASLAVKTLKDSGAKESQMTLISFIGAPEGVSRFQKEHPNVHVVIAQIDEGLDEQKRILPGLGDFGDRYFGSI